MPAVIRPVQVGAVADALHRYLAVTADLEHVQKIISATSGPGALRVLPASVMIGNRPMEFTVQEFEAALSARADAIRSELKQFGFELRESAESVASPRD